MAEVKLKENESLDNALRRFKKQCARSGILTEVKRREHYEKPSVKRKILKVVISVATFVFFLR